jgi:hypothetical protein
MFRNIRFRRWFCHLYSVDDGSSLKADGPNLKYFERKIAFALFGPPPSTAYTFPEAVQAHLNLNRQVLYRQRIAIK